MKLSWESEVSTGTKRSMAREAQLTVIAGEHSKIIAFVRALFSHREKAVPQKALI